jgi:hypothetical protein
VGSNPARVNVSKEFIHCNTVLCNFVGDSQCYCVYLSETNVKNCLMKATALDDGIRSHDQGDQMSLEKRRLKCGPTHFWPKFGHNFYRIWATTVIFEKLSKVNTRQIGEMSPNLVTLLTTHRFPKPADTAVGKTPHCVTPASELCYETGKA